MFSEPEFWACIKCKEQISVCNRPSCSLQGHGFENSRITGNLVWPFSSGSGVGFLWATLTSLLGVFLKTLCNLCSYSCQGTRWLGLIIDSYLLYEAVLIYQCPLSLQLHPYAYMSLDHGAFLTGLQMCQGKASSAQQLNTLVIDDWPLCQLTLRHVIVEQLVS